MSVHIQVDWKKLFEFSAYVSEFDKNIKRACSDINDATKAVGYSMDYESVARLQRLVNEITGILDASGPDLKNLEQQVEKYARIVQRLDAIGKG